MIAKQPAPLLKLIALDRDDLAILSAHLQDAIVCKTDMAFLSAQKRFALVLSRFDWVAASEGRKERVSCGLHFDRVLGVRQMGVLQGDKEGMLNLLAVSFEPANGPDDPDGYVRLDFSGGAAIRLQVECIEAQMNDLGGRWRAKSCPDHPDRAFDA